MAKKWLAIKASKVELIADTKQIAVDFIENRVKEQGVGFLVDLSVWKAELLEVASVGPDVTITDTTP